MRNVALDLAARKISYCEVADGRVVARRTVGSLRALEDLLGPTAAPARVAIEACREAWHVYRVLEQWGNQPLLVDTTRVRRIGVGEHGRKTDRIDAEKLARAVADGKIPVAHLLSPMRQRLRMELSVRRALVESRAQYIVTVRGLARAHGVRLPSCSADDFVSRIAAAKLDAELHERVRPLLNTLATLDHELAKMDRRLHELCADEPVIMLLMTVPYVGVIVASSFVSVIDEARRFPNAHKVGAYLGLVPAEKTTGDLRRLGAITKQGNSYLRSLLVETCWGILKLRNSDDPLHCWVKAVAKRRGNRIAVVALARRLAGVLWAMWRDGTAYEPDRVGYRSARGLGRQAQDIQLRAAAMARAADKARQRARRFERKLTEVRA